MLVINPLLVILLENILSYSVHSLFILLMDSFTVQKLLSVIKFYLFLFLFLLPQKTDTKSNALIYIHMYSAYVFT